MKSSFVHKLVNEDAADNGVNSGVVVVESKNTAHARSNIVFDYRVEHGEANPTRRRNGPSKRFTGILR